MPLPFERRWGADRKKKDEDGKKEKRDKKKYKTKAEEQMDRQIEELSRQLLEEKHNSRRERLTVTRLQRELTQAKKDTSAKDSLMRDLSKERQSRLDAERRLKEALLESETCKSRLESLQEEFSKMQSTMNAVMEYQNNLEQVKQEKNCLVQKYENDVDKCNTRISNLERENSSLTNEIRNLEAKVTHDEGIRERALLLERLKHLEAENTALVLENDNQREQYEQCLDEVANQVVQALLMQKDLREECLKLHNRVQELEQQNRNLKCVFDSRGVCYQPNSMPQPSFPHTYGSPSNPLHTGSMLSSPHPCPVSNPGHINKPANGGLDHHSDSMYNPSPESYPADKTQQQQHSAPSSDNVVLSQMYTSHYRSPSSPSKYRPAVLQGNNKMPLSSQEAFVAQTCSMDRYRLSISPDATSERLTSLRQHNGATNTHSIRQGERSPQRFHNDYRGAVSSEGPTLQTSTYRFTLASLRTKSGDKSPQERNAWNLIAAPSSHQRYDREDVSSNHRKGVVNGQDGRQLQSVAPVRNGHASSIVVQSKFNGHQNGETRNGYVLSDKYSKPYVHAPFHYAQSLLQELREISSSVKSFESLTLEPKPGTQQKRKAEPHNNGNSRQKLVKGQIALPLARVDSLDSEHGEGYATMPELLDTSTSSLSSASIETTLERVISLSPTPLSPSWTDEGDTLEISLDDQILDSSQDCDQSFTEWTCESQDDVETSSPLKENGECIYAKSDASKEQSSPNHIEPNLPECSSSSRQSSNSEGQGSRLEQLLSPRQCQSCNSERQMNQGNWPHKEQYNCKVNGLATCDHHHHKEDGVTLCNSTKKPSPCSEKFKFDSVDRQKLDISGDASVDQKGEPGKDPEINSNCLSVGNKMNGHEPPQSTKPCSAFTNHHISLNSKMNTSPIHKSPNSHCLVRKTCSGPSLYPLSPIEGGRCCQSPLICSGPLCTAQKRQMEEEGKALKEDCTKHCSMTSPTKDAAKMGADAIKASKTSPDRTESEASTDSIKSAKDLAEKIAMTQTHYVTTAEVKLNSGGRNRSRTESSISLSPWVRAEAELESSQTVSSLDMPPTPCLVLRSPVKSKVLLKDTCNKPMPCSTTEQTVGESSNDNDESTSRQADTELISNKSASIEDQTSIANVQKSEYQKSSYENRIGSFITPSQEETPPATHSSPKKSSSIQNPDDRPVIGINASMDSYSRWRKSIQPMSYGKTTSPRPQRAESSGKLDQCDEDTQPSFHVRSRSLGRNENFPLSGFIKEDNIRIQKTRSLDRDTGRSPSPRRRELMDLPRLESSPRMPGRNKKAPSTSKDSKPDLKSQPAAKTATQKPSSLKLSSTNQELPSINKAASSGETPDGSDKLKSSPRGSDDSSSRSRGITEELIEFRSNSLGENPYLNSVSMESLESDNSDDWGSPCKSPGSGKKAATPLSEFLSSDSDSEEENINFVEMWKARETSPMKLPEWNPQKSVEEHRKKMRESLSDSNRSSNLDKSSSLSSSTSSEQWLLSYPYTDAPKSPLKTPTSPSKQARLSFEKLSLKQSASVSDDDVFILENGIPNGPHVLNKLNSLELRKSAPNNRSSLGENSVMFDFVSSILDELDKEGVVKVEPGSPIKQNIRKTEIDKLNRDKSNAIIQNGHCILESQPEEKCNKENLCNKFNDSLKAGQCNNGIEVRPVRTFSLDSCINDSARVSRPNQTKSDSTDKRTNSPSRIPKATKHRSSSSFGQSLRKITNQREHSKSVSSVEKEKKKESKVRSRIPQLIRNSFRSAISQSGYSKKKDRFPKVDVIRTAISLPGSPMLARSPKLSPSPKLNRSPKLSPSSNLNDEPKQNGSASPILSPKISRSPHLSKSPRLCASPRMAGSPLLNSSPTLLSNGFSDSMDSLGGGSWNGVHSRKSSVASTSSFVVDNVPYIDDSGSSPEGQENKSSVADVSNNVGKDCAKSEMQISSPITSAYHGVGIGDFRDQIQGNGLKRTNVGLDDQISPEMIEDIKQGRLASNWDSLSLGNQSKTSHYNLKNAYSWSENMSKEQAVSEHQVNGLIDEDKELAECVGTIDEECKEEAEAEPCKVQVPLVDGDMMEDFEVDDMCGDDDTGSIRENAAQLTEKERANLLDSLFESDDSEEESISHSDSMSSDSHPGEKEFMKMLGEKNKVIKHQVIRQHSAIYCRVSIMQVDLCTLYTRFGDKEKEALASFDFLRPMEEERRHSLSDIHMKDHRQPSQGIRIHELDDDDCDLLTFDPMMQDDTSLTGSSDQEPTLATESMILSDLMGDSFSSSNRHSFSSSSNSLSSQN